MMAFTFLVSPMTLIFIALFIGVHESETEGQLEIWHD